MAKKKHPAKNTFRASQSFLKDMQDHLSGNLCGHILEAKWVTGQWPDQPSDAMNQGSFLEYLVSGALPKSQKVPLPQFTKSSNIQPGSYAKGYRINDLDRVVNDMLFDYRKAYKNARAMLTYLAAMGLEIVEAGAHKVKGNQEGTLDLLLRATRRIEFRDRVTGQITSVIEKGEMIVVDMKYSGLIGERWSRLGWPLKPSEWTAEQKRYNALQARQYHYLSGGLRYFFWVTDSSGSETRGGEKRPEAEYIGNVALFEVIGLDEETTKTHLATSAKALQDFELFKEIGFTPYPSLATCKQCPLRMACTDKQEYPEPIQINLGVGMLELK
jgi:hypothetical protein